MVSGPPMSSTGIIRDILTIPGQSMAFAPVKWVEILGLYLVANQVLASIKLKTC